MKLSRGLAAVVATALMAGLGIAGAAPASAATQGGTVDGSSTDISSYYTVGYTPCDVWNYGSPLLGDLITVTPSASGTATLTLTGSSWSSGTVVGIYNGSFAEANCLDSNGGTGVFNPTVSVPVVGGQTYVILVWGCSGSCTSASDTYGTYTLDINIPGGGMSAIPAWVQAYGRFGKDAACEAGWAPSWQPWAEPVTGGWVCTRSIPSLG